MIPLAADSKLVTQSTYKIWQNPDILQYTAGSFDSIYLARVSYRPDLYHSKGTTTGTQRKGRDFLHILSSIPPEWSSGGGGRGKGEREGKEEQGQGREGDRWGIFNRFSPQKFRNMEGDNLDMFEGGFLFFVFSGKIWNVSVETHCVN